MKTFTITAGHGGSDPGAVYGGFNERDLMTELRDIIAHKLLEAGHGVKTDGQARINLPLVTAIGLVAGSAAAIELHTNAAASQGAGGVEVISMPKDKAKAQCIAAAIAGALGTKLRGDGGWIDQTKSARGRLGFVRAGGMVVEVFFLSNPAELAAYQAKKWTVASAIAAAIGGLS